MVEVLERLAYFSIKGIEGIGVEGMASRFFKKYFKGGNVVTFEAAMPTN